MDLFLLSEFRELDDDIQNAELVIPERSDRRSKTNRRWLLGFLVTLAILAPFVIYTLAYSDIRRLVYGSDSCGNLCGFTNPKIDGVPCSGVDYSGEIYVVESSQDGRCVSKCPEDYNLFIFTCIRDRISSRVTLRENPLNGNIRSKDFFNENSRPVRTISEYDSVKSVEVFSDQESLENYIHKSWWKIVLSCMISIGIAILGLLLFRFATAALVWSILIFGTLVAVLLAMCFWILYSNIPNDPDFRSDVDPSGAFLLTIAIVLTIVAFVIVMLLLVLFKKIKLVILLYKETAKAVFAMPKMIIIPIITSIFELTVIVLCGVFIFWAATSGDLTEVNPGVYNYVMNFPMQFSMTSVVVITLWTIQIFIGIQYMIIAGCVSTWYFAKDKSALNSPILTSVKNTFIFHLGTIVLGSFILILVALVKIVVRSLTRNRLLKVILECCLSQVEDFIQFLSKNAYIETALHGQPFYKSGKRAAKLLLANAGSLIAINSIGSYVLGMAQLILMVTATGMSYTLFMESPYFFVPLAICFVLNVIIVVVCFGVFKTTIDTMFVCFCEDKVLNDGLARPYAMSRDLMEFVESSKMVFKQTNKP